MINYSSQSDLLSCDKSPQNTRNDQAGICKPGRSHPTAVVQDDGEANPRIWQLCLGTSHAWRPRQTRQSSETGNEAGSGDTASTISGTPAAPKSPQSTIPKRTRRYDYCLLTHDWQDSTRSVNLLHQSPIRLKYTRTQPEATETVTTRIVRQRFFAVRVINAWNNLPESIVNASSINDFKNKLDNHWSDKMFRTRKQE